MRRVNGRSDEEQLVLYARDLRHLVEIERAQRGLLESAYKETVSALASALGTKDTGRASTRSGCSATRWSSRARSIRELASRPRARVRLPAPRHRQDRRARPDPAQAGRAERGRVARDEGAHRARRADDRRRRLPARGRRPGRPLAPRALGRDGLSGRARGRGDPARRADLRGRGRDRRDHEPPAVPGRPQLARLPPRDRRAAGNAVRPEGGRRASAIASTRCTRSAGSSWPPR